MDEARQQELVRRMTELVERDPQLRAAIPDAEVGKSIARADVPLAQSIATLAEGYAERPALAMRAMEFVTDESGRTRGRLLPRYESITYREMWRRVTAVAAAWYHDDESPIRAGDFVSTLGFTSTDYVVIDLACTISGAVSVPLQTGAPVDQLAPIAAETEPRILAASVEQIGAAVDLAMVSPSVRMLVVFDHQLPDDDHRAAVESARARLAERRVIVRTLAEVIAQGGRRPAAPLHTGADEEALALLVYTSGSTGTPKGAMYPERLVARMWRGSAGQPFPSIGFSFMPMSHIAGRGLLLSCLSRGGTAYFAAKSDMSTLFEDLALARPTVLFFVPRVCDMLFQRFCAEVDRRVAAGEVPATAERQVKTELREDVLGARVLMASSSSAPLSKQLHEFMASVLGFDMVDGYGATESSGAIIIDTVVTRPPVTDYKLVDVPELGYFGTDKPYPRGELLLQSETLIPGYYKRPELNAEIFDDDGFYRTGDIMAELAPDRLVYVDRRNNVLKLSQGEFVTVAKLEAAYVASPLVRQIYVYGSSERAYLLAVVVPTPEALAAHPDTGDLTTAITESLREVAREAGLNSYEIPRAFLLEPEPFTLAGGLLSGVAKLLRPKLKQRYGDRLEQLYADLARQTDDEQAALRREAAQLPVLETLGRAARALLGCASTDVRPDVHFTDLGGDSLSALSYSTLLREILGVEVPVGVIIGPATDLADLARYVESERESGGTRPTVATVHGSGTRIRATDLTLDRFIDRATLDAAPGLPHAAPVPATVLLTGANGYLGRFLCLEWLQRLNDSGGRLICVVRGGDAATARARLDEVFDTGDPELVQRYRTLAEDTLEVLAGDIGEPNLGLSEQDWRRLADTADLIVHPAALVNHVLPYGQLFGPNVVGTAEVIRLALTTTIKPVTYLSTVAVAGQIAPETFTEDGDIREISPVRTIDDGYANGYGNSKWAGEVLLREAHELCGLPVGVFRSDMILAHSRYAGQLNVPDMFTRLLFSVLVTGIAPKSFYATDSRGNRQCAHYDGLPADFTAAAITELGARITSGFETFDVLNPHDDGISLDEFVDWLMEAGYSIERIDGYGEWLRRFETAMRGLPEEQRGCSLLPLLHVYRTPGIPLRGAALPAKKFQAAVQAAGLGSDHDIPHLDRALIEKYATDLALRKLL